MNNAKNVHKLLSRFVIATVFIALLLSVVNVLLLLFFLPSPTSKMTKPSNIISNISKQLTYKNQKYILPIASKKYLHQKKIWVMLLNNKGEVIWYYDLPNEIPKQYTTTDVAQFSKWYLKEYPVYCQIRNDGLLVLGFPKNSFSKYSLDYSTDIIRAVPFQICWILLINGLLALFLAMGIGLFYSHSINPIVNGIYSLADQKIVVLKPRGILSDIAKSINKTSKILEKKNTALKKRDQARSNWIAGVSHDIRTPLSMVIGYASKLEKDKTLSKTSQNQLTIIKQQGVKIRNLVEDLNLASKLEYDMQPLNYKEINIVALTRKIIANYINLGLNNDYTINFHLNTKPQNCIVNGDERLLKRAITNLIHNSINHNPQGCIINIKIESNENKCEIIISDNGKGVSKSQFHQLINNPHYMNCNNNFIEPHHGLGLSIVQQIIKSHNGSININSKENKGFEVKLSIPTISIK